MTLLEIVHEPIDRVATLIKQRHISPLALTQFCIQRIKSTHDQLNAVCEERFDDAIELARLIEANIHLPSEQARPLLGIPFVVSANIGIAGMRLDMGTWNMHGHRSTTTATVIHRLTKAGAIPLCTTNISELGIGYETANPIYGRTNNPWHRGRSPGGSNGGAAALLASGVGLFAIGNDFGGSLRVPALFCGTYAHKPSRGVVPLTGQYPFLKPEAEISWRAMDGIGPMTRHAQDLALLLDMITGPCPLDPMSMTGSRVPYKDDLPVQKIAIIEDPKILGVSTTSPEMRMAVRKAAQLLSEVGAEMIDAPQDLFCNASSLYRHAVHRAVDGKFRQLYGGGKARKPVFELAKVLTGQSEHSLSSCLQMFSEEYLIKPERLRSLDTDTAQLRRSIDALFSKASLLIIPTFPETAPRHLWTMLRPANPAMAGVINILGLPATAVPMGVSGSGLPVGVQIIAPQGQDARAIAAARIIGEYIPSPLARQ